MMRFTRSRDHPGNRGTGREDEIVRLILHLAHTGQEGDGIVWVTPVEMFYRLRF
ncbi:MAG: P-II family nitrogen regulator [Methylococcaceae bacterium]|nr:P-II family nitrogen regulator [Methylococcaceae bacterium]